MNIFKNFSLGFKKGLKKLNFMGRSSRKEILQITIITPLLLITTLMAWIILSSFITSQAFFVCGISAILFMMILNFFASITAIGRRFQDIGWTGWLAIPLIFLSPVIYFFVGMFLLITPSGKHNKYGPNLSTHNIESESLENYIYYKYFSMNPIHDKMSQERSTSYNNKMAQEYKKLIPEEEFNEFENIMNTNIQHDTIDFSQQLPSLNNDKAIKNLMAKHGLENFNFNELISEIRKYSQSTHLNKMYEMKEKEINS